MTFSGPRADDEVDRRQVFVATARALADETGSAAFTVAQLTTRAGLSLKAFYACFQSKDDLLLALLGEDSRMGAEVLAGIIGDRVGARAIHAYVTGLFQMLAPQSAVGYAGVLVREYRRLIEFHDDELRDAVAPLVDLLARDVETEDPKRDARTMFGVLLDGIHDIVVGRVTDADALARYLERFCTRGVAGL